jgi:hypothetical protein
LSSHTLKSFSTFYCRVENNQERERERERERELDHKNLMQLGTTMTTTTTHLSNENATPTLFQTKKT